MFASNHTTSAYQKWLTRGMDGLDIPNHSLPFFCLRNKDTVRLSSPDAWAIGWYGHDGQLVDLPKLRGRFPRRTGHARQTIEATKKALMDR